MISMKNISKKNFYFLPQSVMNSEESKNGKPNCKSKQFGFPFVYYCILSSVSFVRIFLILVKKRSIATLAEVKSEIGSAR